MPDHKTHKEFSRLFGIDSSRFDRYIDEPYKHLGKKHRKIRHDTTTILYLGLKHGDKGLIAGYLHVLLDENEELVRVFKSLRRV